MTLAEVLSEFWLAVRPNPSSEVFDGWWLEGGYERHALGEVDDPVEPQGAFAAKLLVTSEYDARYLGRSSAIVRCPCSASSIALNSAVKRLRVFMVDLSSRHRIQLSHLSQEPGTPWGAALDGRTCARFMQTLAQAVGMIL